MTALLAYLTELLVDGKLTSDETRKIIVLAKNANLSGYRRNVDALCKELHVSRATFYRRARAGAL
jgi:hypothetical protein